MSSPDEQRPLWEPTVEQREQTDLARFMRWAGERHGREFADYEELWRWSIGELEDFWADIWEYCGVRASRRYERVLGSHEMPGTDWFAGAELNFAENVLLADRDPDAVAVLHCSELRELGEITWGELSADVAAAAAGLRSLGVGRGDRVVAYMPNIPETLIAFLAVASIGAIWSSAAPEFGARSVVDRFAQIEPKVLLAVDGYRHGGKDFDRNDVVASILGELPTVEHTVILPYLAADGTRPPAAAALSWAELLARGAGVPADFEQVPFAHPLWVLYSSGTTGLPKGIVHSHGGVLVEYVKMMGLHLDLGPSDRFTWYTSPSWVVWNCLVGALTCGGSILCYDGAPQVELLWPIVAEYGVTVFGTSPGFLAASQDAGVHPSGLSALRSIGSTGAPLPERAYDWVAAEFPGVPLYSMSGGTDIAGAFAMGAPGVPVRPGEIPVRGLGVALEAWSDTGEPLVEEVGELVVTRPMPSMPLYFWNDPAGARYRAAYFDTFPGVWRHGDWITLSEHGSLRVHGRSDSTLNRNGVRMGSADIYAAVEAMDAVTEALVIGAEEDDGGYWMPLFVVVAPGHVLDGPTVAAIRERIREQASPRHVPDDVIAVRGIPHTRTGKKLEVPIMEDFRAIAADRAQVRACRVRP